jgi:enoyl-CoA hydratase
MLDQRDYEQMLIEKRADGVALITLNRPERHNATTSIMHAEFAQLPGDIQADPAVRAAVITGAGRSFCSGADVQQRLGGSDGMSPVDVLVEPREIIEGFFNLDKPVVTAVKGYALGFGCTAALLGDIVIAGRSARFADPHVSVGLTAGDGGAVLWPLLAGPQQAKYYLMTGEQLDAETALRIGLVFKVVDDDAVLDEALAIAARFAAGAPYAIRSTKRSINRIWSLIAHDVLPFSLAAESLALTTSDHVEAVAALREKRPPNFTGR